ncbi:MAG: PAS domain-containing sensor histidine kinase [Calditrichaeota bacterium]|nr:MAG: PAS domain-containing sensor histidine kinase [Calditrichota bacterium]
MEILPAPVSFNNKPAVQVVLSDITEQNRLLSKLRDAAFSYRGLFDNAPDAIYILNTKGDFIEINKSVETLYGLSRAYYLGKNIKDLTPVKKETIKTIRNTFNKVLKGTPQKFEYQGKRRDGSVYTERLSLYLSLYFGQDVIIAYGQDITEYKKSLEELHLSEESFRGLFDNASDAIYIQDEKGRILDVNKSVEKMYGFPRDYFIGKTPLDVAAPNLNNLEQVAALFNETFSTGKSNHFEFWAVRKNGEVFPKEVRISRSLYFGQIVVLAFAQDITHRKAQEKALLASENRFRQLIESAPVGIGMVYKNKLTFTNPTFNSIFGYKDNLAGHSIEEFFTEDEHKKLQTISSALKKSAKHIQMELKGTHQDGSTIPVQLNAAVIEQEEGAAILFFITDISSLKREQEKRLELEKQVLQTQKLESLGVLAGGIAHDFNNLLTGIMGNTGLAMMEIPENTPAQNNLMKIEQIAGRAADLCNQMLAYSGRGNFVIKTVNMNTMIQDIIELINVSLSKKIQIIYDLEKDLPNNDADAQQMSQVILNLITNAADAIGSNPGIITVKTYSDFFDSAELHSSYMESVPAEGRYTVFEVRDTGKGMDQDTISKIFEPFFTTKFTGRGLGLSAVLGIIRGHKGCIQIESTPGKGSVFRVFLPVSEKEKTEAGRPAQLPGQDWKAEGRVLVADDETHILEMAEAVLQKIGYTVVTAPNGLEAVELFRQAPDSFDLIILDLTMPVLSGEEAYDHIREIAPDIPVILSSGFTDTEARIRFKDKAPAGFLQKPYTIEKLRHTLYKLSKKKAPDNT